MIDNFSREIHTEALEYICEWNLSSCQRIKFDFVVSKNEYFSMLLLKLISVKIHFFQKLQVVFKIKAFFY